MFAFPSLCEAGETGIFCAPGIPPKPTPYQELKIAYYYPVRNFFVEAWSDVPENIFLWLVIAISLSILALGLFRRVMSWLKPRIVSGIYYQRGVEVIGEATMQGSPFLAQGMIPTCQVEVYRPGILIDTFIGYATRISNTLAMPAHVYRAAVRDHKLMVQTRTGKVILVQPPLPSKIVSDVVYFLLDQGAWARLAIPKAQPIDVAERPVPVNITGKEGTASGYATKSPVPHLLSFNGSTLPGYSGALYVFNGAAYGMHLGIANNGNVGVAMESLQHEVRRISSGEARKGGRGYFQNGVYVSPPESDGSSTNSVGNNLQYNWRADQPPVDDDEDYYSQPKTAEEIAAFKKFHKNYSGEAAEVVEEIHGMSVSELEALIQYASGMLQSRKNVPYKPQSDTPNFESLLQVEEDPVVELVQDVRKLKSDVQVLNRQMEELQKHFQTKPQQPNPFPCDECGKSFKSAMARMVHKASKHMQGESAIPSDSKTTTQLKPASFLGKTKSLTNKRWQGSTKPLNSSNAGIQSTSGTKPPSKIQTSRSDLANACEILLKAISGLKEEPVQ